MRSYAPRGPQDPNQARVAFQDGLNNVAGNYLQNMMAEEEAMMQQYGAPPPYNSNEKKAVLHIRKGYCGVVSDALLAHMNANHLNSGGYAKMDRNANNETHFFLVSADRKTIIEPTYKQMFFSRGQLAQNADHCINSVRNFPTVFAGTPQEFSQVVDAMCQQLGISQEKKNVLRQHWF